MIPHIKQLEFILVVITISMNFASSRSRVTPQNFNTENRDTIRELLSIGVKLE